MYNAARRKPVSQPGLRSMQCTTFMAVRVQASRGRKREIILFGTYKRDAISKSRAANLQGPGLGSEADAPGQQLRPESGLRSSGPGRHVFRKLADQLNATTISRERKKYIRKIQKEKKIIIKEPNARGSPTYV